MNTGGYVYNAKCIKIQLVLQRYKKSILQKHTISVIEQQSLLHQPVLPNKLYNYQKKLTYIFLPLMTTLVNSNRLIVVLDLFCLINVEAISIG